MENKINEALEYICSNTNFRIDWGKEKGKNFLIFDSWEDQIAFMAVINGYKGDLNIYHFCSSFENLSDLFDRTILELENTNPKHIGSISRLESKLRSLSNYSTYKRWLLNNEIEELSIDGLGVEYGFCDEYCLCAHCQNEVVRTSADCYQWTPPLFIDYEGYVCDNCIHNYTDHVLEEYKNVEKGIPHQFTIDDLGLVKINKESFQNGWFAGMDDIPGKLIEAFSLADIDVYFKVYPSQFYVEFDCYVRAEQEKEALELINKVDSYQGYSSVAVLKNQLANASLELNKQLGDNK